MLHFHTDNTNEQYDLHLNNYNPFILAMDYADFGEKDR